MLEVGKVKNTEQVAVIWTNGKNSTFYYVGASMLPLISKRQWSTSSAGKAMLRQIDEEYNADIAV